jgi:hypothetical protein
MEVFTERADSTVTCKYAKEQMATSKRHPLCAQLKLWESQSHPEQHAPCAELRLVPLSDGSRQRSALRKFIKGAQGDPVLRLPSGPGDYHWVPSTRLKEGLRTQN